MASRNKFTANANNSVGESPDKLIQEEAKA